MLPREGVWGPWPPRSIVSSASHGKTDNFLERCYKKPCAGPTTTTTTCILDDLVFLDNGCCRFNHLMLTSSTYNHIEHMGAQTEEACLAYCNENPRCIAADIRYPDPEMPYLEENVTYNVTFYCTHFFGDGSNFNSFFTKFREETCARRSQRPRA